MWPDAGVEIFYSPIWGKVIILIIILIIRFIIKGLKQVMEFPTPKLNFSTVITWGGREFLLKGFLGEPFAF